MGEKAVALFEQAKKLGGIVGQVKLASIARVTSTEAAAVEDSQDLIQRLESALASLRLTDKSPAAGPRSAPPAPEGAVAVAPNTGEQTRVLRKHLQTYVELMTQRALLLGDVEATIRRINEAASQILDVERVSVWLLDSARTKIRCADIFIRTGRQHASGVELFAKDYVPYFAALATERTIAADDAHKDPRTSCFSAGYLTPLGINSLLDVPIWVQGKMVGVVCHEHVGPMRKWDGDEETFAYLMANFVALAMDRAK